MPRGRGVWLGLLVGAALAAVGGAGGGGGAAWAQSAVAESAALTNRAGSLMADGQLSAAAKLYQNAISLQARNLPAYLGLSAVWARLGKHAEALALLERAESLVGWSAALGAQRGSHLVALKSWAEAQRELERVMGSDSAAFDAALYLGDVYLQTGAWAKAVAPLSTYLAQRPRSLAEQDGEVRTRLSLALMKSGQDARAERELGVVLAARPRDIAARVLLGTLYARGRCKKALELLDPMLVHVREAPSIQLNRALCLVELARPVEARRALAAYQKLRPADPAAEQLRARIEAAAGDLEQAVVSYRKALEHGHPVERELGELLLRMGRTAEALEVLWPLVVRGVASTEMVTTLLEAALEVKDTEKALLAGAQLVQAKPGEARSFVLRGRAELMVASYVLAERSFAQALALEPADAQAGRGLRIALERQAYQRVLSGDADAAFDMLTRANAVDPGALGVVQNLALMALERGDARGAIDRLLPVIDRMPRPGVALRVLARAQAMLGDRKAAQATLERMAAAPDASVGDVTTARIDLAVILRDGDPEAALKLLDQPPVQGTSAELLAELRKQHALTLVLTGEDKLFAGHAEAARRDLEAARTSGLLPAGLEVRVRVGMALAAGLEGYRATSDKLATITDPELASVLVPGLASGGRDLLLLFAAYLEADRLSISEQSRVMRDSRRLLGAVSSERMRRAATGLLAAWLDRTLHAAAQKRQSQTVARLKRETPVNLQHPTFQHNAIVAGASTLGSSQIEALSNLASQVPEARVNLAIAYELAGDHARALAQLKRAVDAHVSVAGLREWLEWKEAVNE